MRLTETLIIGLLAGLCAANAQRQLDLAPAPVVAAPPPVPEPDIHRPDDEVQVSKPGAAPVEWVPQDNDNPRPPPVDPLPAPRVPIPSNPATRPITSPSRPVPTWSNPWPQQPKSSTRPAPSSRPPQSNPWDRPVAPTRRPDPTPTWRPDPTPTWRADPSPTYRPNPQNTYSRTNTPDPRVPQLRTTTIYLPKNTPAPGGPPPRGGNNSGGGNRQHPASCGGRNPSCLRGEFCFDTSARKILPIGSREGAGICFASSCRTDNDCPTRQVRTILAFPTST